MFDPVDLLSSTGTLLRLIISIYNCSYLQYYYIHKSILRIKSFVKKKTFFLKEIYNVVKTESCSVLNCPETLIATLFQFLYRPKTFFLLSQDCPVLSQNFLSVSQDPCPKGTVPGLLSQDPCPKTSVPRPLSQDYCPKTSVPRPLSQDYCPKASVPRPLSQDHYPKASVPRLLSQG